MDFLGLIIVIGIWLFINGYIAYLEKDKIDPWEGTFYED